MSDLNKEIEEAIRNENCDESIKEFIIDGLKLEIEHKNVGKKSYTDEYREMIAEYAKNYKK